ncbi:helix-turn-helix transcriptional regulator [Paenibacillus sp. IB182496]|uniref:Helix-turn-helix transcriptional regulator n=1 Tax=Paenibacillus sabuli TaxID=2772509 RepID=A0A927BNG5_9BACL|nr:AraC family transcriptional regulator [Paenibacillus sabuli]MBD2843777.1 helix-turn-helix transcriptional regulator [Paenibacillus sabuli]
MKRQLQPQYGYHYRRRTSDRHLETFHAHPGLELCYVHAGRGRLWLDERHYSVGPDMLLIFQPFQLHRVQMEVSAETPFVRTVLQFDPALLADHLPLFPELQRFFRHLHDDRLETPVLTGWTEDSVYTALLAEYAHVLPQLSEADNREQYVQLLLMLLRLVQHRWRADKERGAAQPRPQHRAEEVMAWIDRHYAEVFRMERLASALYLSSSHLSHLFREATGSTIGDYIAARRMREAGRLLTSTALAIPEIAVRVGLGSPSYFCQVFKKRMGTSPHRYRLINRNEAQK